MSMVNKETLALLVLGIFYTNKTKMKFRFTFCPRKGGLKMLRKLK
jgi:hypothetical protein